MSTTIGVAEAKTRLSEVIDRVLAGEAIVIARNGEPLVELRAIKKVTPEDAVARIRAIGERIRRRNAGKAPLLQSGQSYRDLAHEGHRI
jgi:prevent-host-death family protein